MKAPLALPPPAASRVDSIAARIASLRQGALALNEGKSVFGLSVVSEGILPALETALAQHRATPSDPNAANRERALLSVLTQCERLVEVMTEARATLPDEVITTRLALQASNIPVAWTSNELNGLVGAANRIAEQMTRQPMTESIEQLAQAILVYRARLAQALVLDAEIRETTTAIAETQNLVTRTRDALAQRSGVAPSEILNVPPTPETLLADARDKVAAVRTTLGNGDIVAAMTASREATDAVSKVRDLVAEAVRNASAE